MEKSQPENGPGFEEALGELQQIVSQLEDGSLGLEESMQRFEKGMSLLRHCYCVLEKADQKIEILTGFDAQGNPITAEFDGSATHDPNHHAAGRRPRRRAEEEVSSTEPAPDDNGQRLF
jgi:exodeoxyribonuclease VII small subunit